MPTMRKAIIIDRGWNKIKASCYTLDKSYVKVGYPAEDKEERKEFNLTNTELAMFHEFGTKRLPPRPFVRLSFDNARVKINTFVNKTIDKIITNKMNVSTGLDHLGLFGKNIIQAFFPLIQPPLKPLTIARKGSSKPLIDTGQLRASVTFVKVIK
ncbi:MAG: hypothetical protein A2V66_11950 [Ignavibacteria bacterium RBG_13_36_8]|nr:MAG: hypothetical protein A2V66_11950 [Ignavibacteria bacterium RBG_13_36_8]